MLHFPHGFLKGIGKFISIFQILKLNIKLILLYSMGTSSEMGVSALIVELS